MELNMTNKVNVSADQALKDREVYELTRKAASIFKRYADIAIDYHVMATELDRLSEEMNKVVNTIATKSYNLALTTKVERPKKKLGRPRKVKNN